MKFLCILKTLGDFLAELRTFKTGREIAHFSRELGVVRVDGSSGTMCVWLGSSQVRFAHTDVSFPDFSAYRRDSVKDPTADSQASAPARKAFTYVALAGTELLALLHTLVV